MVAAVSACHAQHHTIVKLWETDSVVNLPESVLPAKEGYLFASQMGNNPNDKDGIGGIAKISLTGKMLNADWITGLNAPKGLGRFGNTLYAADLDEVVAIDIERGKVIKKIPVEGAKFLNDITIDDKGIVYVSDSRTKKIHRIENGMVSTYLENIAGVNGLKSIGSDLYIAAGKYLKKADKNRELTQLAELPQGGDGLEPVGNGDFLWSAWAGYLYYVYADGHYDLLLDTHLEKKNTADIAYDPVRKIIYVPTFWKKSVMAYQLK
ncbi:ATP-binding protein [Pedobacter sp. BS3]|nr:ATP-binding protein [Pedobacter sp. BS3]